MPNNWFFFAVRQGAPPLGRGIYRTGVVVALLLIMVTACSSTNTTPDREPVIESKASQADESDSATQHSPTSPADEQPIPEANGPVPPDQEPTEAGFGVEQAEPSEPLTPSPATDSPLPNIDLPDPESLDRTVLLEWPFDLSPDSSSPAVGLWDGVISISERCIWWSGLGAPDGVTLFWPAGYARHDAASRSVEFTGANGEEYIIHDGDWFDIGGARDALFPDAVSRPHDECPKEWFRLYDLSPPRNG
ncbi:MAG: hypothetical protein OSA06_07645 [Acidimicrobiales bacterium]|nr:hypothetical protein [Acidimicrobiales bacterium]